MLLKTNALLSIRIILVNSKKGTADISSFFGAYEYMMERRDKSSYKIKICVIPIEYDFLLYINSTI